MEPNRENLEDFLKSLNLSQYIEKFREAGFDDLETVISLSEDEPENQMKIDTFGHRRKLVLNFKIKETYVR